MKYFRKLFLAYLIFSATNLISMEQSGQIRDLSHDENELPEILLKGWLKENLPDGNMKLKRDELYYKLLPKYKQLEAEVPSIYNNPLASAIGGINYAMTFEEMQERIKQKFKKMNDLGLILTPAEFKEVESDYYPLKRSNLTRIWCADYLKEKFKDCSLKEKYDVPDYIIVLNEQGQKKIKITWFFADLFPLAAEIRGATIYFKEIKGKEAARCSMRFIKDIGYNSEIGFMDFSDPGNIIKEKATSKYYIVDTELKGFKLPIHGELLSKIFYARERFKYLHNKILYENTELNLED